jgi:hypothetical protein
LLLIFRLNKRVCVPDIWLALGDETIKDIAVSFVGMPMFVLMGRICPEGVESSVFALVTSMQMVGATVRWREWP